MSFLKNTIKKIGYNARLGDMISLSNLIYVCAGNNYTRLFIGSWYIFLVAGSKGF